VSSSKRSQWWDIPVTLAIAVAIVLVVTTFIVKPFSIPSGSMENTLAIGDRVLVDKVTYRFRDVDRGDVIVFDGRNSFVPAREIPERDPITGAVTWVGQSLGLMEPDTTDFIKRVIGISGDRVTCCDADGQLLVNGTPLQEGQYLYPGDQPSSQSFDVIVPEGKLWVMGDHRSNSADSRAHLGDPGGGFVSRDAVVGRGMSVVWPIGRWTGLDIPAAFAALTADSP
jgi:signal peptidase I